MKARGVDRVFDVFFLLAILIISIFCNIGDFTGGSGGKINPLTVAITTIYVVYCSAFALFSHNRKSIITMTILGASTLIVAVFGLLISTFRLKIGVIIPFAIVFLSPFQGLVPVMSSNWTVIYSVIIVICVLWVIFGIFNFRRHHKNIKANRNHI